MYDTVRWVILALLFAGLFAAWYWARRRKRQDLTNGTTGSAFKVLKKRWVDQRTGVCLVEAEDQTFLLAYTIGGGVSWQPVEKAAPEPAAPDFEKTINRLSATNLLPETRKP